jgi:hypothetical protein
MMYLSSDIWVIISCAVLGALYGVILTVIGFQLYRLVVRMLD